MRPRLASVALALAFLLADVQWTSAQMAVHTVSITTDGSGNATAYTKDTYGRISAIRYVPDVSTPLTATADLTITDNETGLTVMVITDIGSIALNLFPRAAMIDTTGAAVLYASGGQAVRDQIPVGGAIKVVVSGGGASKLGTLYFFIEGR